MGNLQYVMRPSGSHFETELRNFCSVLRTIVGESPTIVELGSYMGESSLIFSEEFPNGTIYCIDSWEGGFDHSDTCSRDDYNMVENQFNMRLELTKNIIKIKGLSTSEKIECDVVYIDACHKYECVKSDILHWSPLVKQVISGHDYYENDAHYRVHPHIAGVKSAVNELLGTPDHLFNDGSWIKIKK
jgi:hypothetical protein